ncbi:disease resistance protein Roq1-like [Capsicum chacoense]
MEKVERWRNAFAVAGKLKGHHLQNYKDEGECIKKVVDEISSKSLHVISPFSDGLVGIQSQIEKVISLLDIESNVHVVSVGIWGMSGIGKTEIASAIYGEYFHKFDAGCFLDVGVMYQKKGITWLQQALIRELLGIKKTITREHVGATFISNRLRQKKVLIILDDVNQRKQLEFLVGGPEWFGRGSRIILTARDKHLLISHAGDNVYEVQLLSDDEALELFSRHAFREKSPKKDFMDLSRQVVEYAGGLPLALKVLGSSFYGRDKKHWRHIIDRLKRIPHNDILGKLRLSFEGLDKDEKEIFLAIAFMDIACFGGYNFGLYVELVLRDVSRGFQLIMDHLIEKSLLVTGINNRIVMHNIIREMAQNVIREEYANSRIWLPEVCDLLRGKLMTEKVKSLCIPKDYDFEDELFNCSKILMAMQSLQVLIIGLGTFSSACAITYLPSSLQFIEWGGYPSISLPESFEPSQLIVLRFYRSCLVALWPISKNLSNLKHLDLGDSLGLTKTPNFRDIPNLGMLVLEGCENLQEVHPSLGHCRMLTYLNLYGCVKLEKLPKFVTMESLETLDLLKCTNLKRFPEICGDMRRLSKLYVGSPKIRSLPTSLSGLRDLMLRDCGVLRSIPDATENLEYLYIKGCKTLATLPNSLFESQQLEYLHICLCSGMVELPISLGIQKKLRQLELIKCLNLKKIPSSIQMESLQLLKISNCPKLGTFPEINGDMHCLKKLTMESTRIRELPLSIGNLSGLTKIILEGCEYLVSLPNSLCNLMNLQRLFLRRCKKLENLPENIGDLHELKELDARETAIYQLPPSITKLGKLRDLRFSHVLQHVQHSSTFVFHQLSALSFLNHVHLGNLNILCGLPEDLGSFQSLKRLDVSRSNISCLPKSIKELLHLKHLNVQFCQDLNELPEELPPHLLILDADYHLALKSIRHLVTECRKMRKLIISWCGHEKSECQNVSSEQVNVQKFLRHFLRTCIQCDFHQRASFLISFPKLRIPKLFDHQFINQKAISIDLNPSWYTDKFMGFSMCYGPSEGNVSGVYKEEACWGIRLEYENKCRRWRRKLRETQSRELFPVLQKNTESGFSMVLEPSLPSSSRASAEHNIATDRGLYKGYEKKALDVDQAAMAVQKEHTSQNVELISVCGSPSRNMDNVSRKRERKRNRKKKRKMARTDGTSCSHCTN